MTNCSITYLIPTHNRPPFLRRVLKFYGQFPPGCVISVVDSSCPTAAAENASIVQAVSPELTVGYQHYELDIVNKCVRALERVVTPLVVFVADDDFLFPDAVNRCAEFLANNPAFGSAMGRTAVLDALRPHRRCQVLKGVSLEAIEPFDRCRQIAGNWFSNFYAVHRTESLLNNFQLTAANTDFRPTLHIPEMLLSQLSVLRGRVKVLTQMYSLREQHGGNAGSARTAGERSQMELLYCRFKSCLADQFCQAGIQRADAERFIEFNFRHYRIPGQFNRRRGIAELVAWGLWRIVDQAVGFFQKDITRQTRYIRAGDCDGIEAVWQVAVRLIRDFPKGIPLEHKQIDVVRLRERSH